MNTIHPGDALAILPTLPAASVHVCITSPPYWGLRDYGLPPTDWPAVTFTPAAGLPPLTIQPMSCCLGLEPEPWAFVAHLVLVFREVRRVLRGDGTCWVNLGDSYIGNANSGGNSPRAGGGKPYEINGLNPKMGDGLKPKDLIGIPWMCAKALQADGWWLRSAPPWIKDSAMPESVRDRPTVANEYVFLLSKSARYFFDAEAVRITGKEWTGNAGTFARNGDVGQHVIPNQSAAEHRPDRNDRVASGRNRRTSDFFYESLDAHISHLQHVRDNGGLMLDIDGNPMAFLVNPQPYKEAHFACVDDKTEALTADGWKNYKQLTVGELIAAYDMNTRQLEFVPLDNIAVYKVTDQEMVNISGRGIDQLLTPNHRCLIQRKSGNQEIIRADKLKVSHKILVSSSWKDNKTVWVPNNLAALIGWYVTEGSAGDSHIYIYQSGDANPEYCEEIRSLLKSEGAIYNEYSRERVWRERKVKSISWRIIGPVANTLLALCPDKRLPSNFLNWDTESLNILWDALMKGDGHFRDAGRQTFVQKDKILIDQVQALATRLGYSTTLRKRSKDTWSLYKTESRTRLLRSETSELIKKQIYSGIVWCPQTEHTTFVARRNGYVFITGNTFPTKLIEPMILASTSARGVCPACGAPWVRVVEREFIAQPDIKNPQKLQRDPNGLDASSGWAGSKRGSIGTTTTGWRPTCACDVKDDPVPATILDPFFGSGTTGQVAIETGRRYIGIELSEEYIELARRRLAGAQPALIARGLE